LEAGYWLIVVVGFGFLIFAHEMGHFLACKLVGVRVIRFALGFGPRLIGKKIGETDYCICAIPCGGYVKMAGGEGETDKTATGANDEFPQKTPGQRALVVVAGPIFSVAIALPLLFSVFIAGLERPSSRINQVMPETPAWEAGLKRGDVITGLKMDGEDEWTTIHLWRQVKLNQILGDKVGEIVIRVDRDGVEKQFKATTTEKGGYAIGLNPAIAGKGMGKQMGYISTLVGHVPSDSAFAAAGITPGCRVREVDGRAVHTWTDVEEALLAIPGKSVEIKFDDPDGKEQTGKLTVTGDKYWWLGVHAERPNVVRLVRPNFPADKAGIKPGDRIIEVGGKTVANWAELQQHILDAGPKSVELKVLSGAEPTPVQVELERGEDIVDVLGIAADSPVVTGFAKDSKAKAAGVQVGDTLLRFFCRDPEKDKTEEKEKAADDEAKPKTDGTLGKPAEEDEEEKNEEKNPYGGRAFVDVPAIPLLVYGGSNPNKPPKAFKMLIERDGEKKLAEITPVFGERGIPDASARIDKTRVVPPGNIGAAISQAVYETGRWVGLAGRTLWMLVTGKISGDMVSGPVGIFTVSRSQAEVGMLTFIEFMVIITVHLGVINLVPFPVLDGGHLVFLLVEKVRGKPVNEVVMGRILYAGMMLLIALMLFVTWNDITRIFG
jgi:regulator of sigma E protease